MNKKLLQSIPTDIVNAMALKSVKKNVNQACAWFFHQPELPEAAKKFKNNIAIITENS